MDGPTPLGRIGVLAVQEVAITPTLRHVEVFTRGGLLTVLWHGPKDADAALVACGGALGGLLGPANGLYQFLGDTLGEQGIATLRVSYRRPNDLDACITDVGAASEMAVAEGVREIVVMGHSFGGAVALNAAIHLGALSAGLVTLATQSAGCEVAEALGTLPFLLVHGARDEILPVWSSQVVREIAGTGELIVHPDAGHLLLECADELRQLLPRWIGQALGRDDDA